MANSTTGNHAVHNGTEWQSLHGRSVHDCIQTVSGKFFWPLEPRADEILVEDVAHGLASEFRYGNHAPIHYPVAWHCVALSRVVPRHLAKFALVHDAAEAYLKDIPRPLRRQEPFKTMYQEIHDRLLEECCIAFGVENQEEELHKYDIRMSHAEMLVFAETSPIYLAKVRVQGFALEEVSDEWKLPVKALMGLQHDGDFDPIEESRVAFLDRYRELWQT